MTIEEKELKINGLWKALAIAVEEHNYKVVMRTAFGLKWYLDPRSKGYYLKSATVSEDLDDGLDNIQYQPIDTETGQLDLPVIE